MSVTRLTKPIRRRALVAGKECTLSIEKDTYGVHLTVRKHRSRRLMRFNLTVVLRGYLAAGRGAPSLLEQSAMTFEGRDARRAAP